MRRILITDRIIGIAHRFAQEMEDDQNFKHAESPKTRLEKLSKNLKKSCTVIKLLKCKASKRHPAVYINKRGNELTALSDYVKAIYDHYVGLNALLPSEYDSKISQYVDNTLAPISGYDISEIKVKLRKKRLAPFFELIVEAMRYDKVQKDIMPQFIKDVGIKTCVYCNAQYATTATIQELKKVKKGKWEVWNIDAACYELDHNIAKSVKPYLCTNFYNLQPSCSSCNRRKNNRDLGFSLYYEEGETDVRPVHIALKPSDIINFRITNKGQGIKPFLCNEGSDIPPVISDETTTVGRMNKMLGLQGIYDEHEDIVEEILWKHKIYSEGFMTATVNQIKSLGIEGFDMKRFILGGYYDREDDFLKRPLSIMKNDIWEQLERN